MGGRIAKGYVLPFSKLSCTKLASIDAERKRPVLANFVQLSLLNGTTDE